eukprot:CAMPEP_0197028794 /NCGR_PEP_ID=MMETSP1384-20130603/8400_1 /TAXON_ID=29189 /ORGANISM="Ammonia sp." /LENGTH=368 /DNA_ID=CAMNT_0042457851 /DNA_START=14 /DNA_END=1120 /DNA_ORIENTATION=+
MGTGGSTENDDTGNEEDGKVPVILHVYQPGPDEQSPIGMVYHSGVEVYGSEYFYGGGGGGGTGIMVQKPKSQPRGSTWVYYQSHVISKHINKSREEVREIVSALRQEWKARDYHLTNRNCNHFSDAFVKELCGENVSIPSWVNRLARMGNMMMGSGLVSDSTKKQLNQQMSGKGQEKQAMMQNAELAADYGSKHGPQPVIEYVPESKTIYLLDHVNLNECGALNLCEQQSSSDLSLLFTQNLDSNAISVKSENDEQLLLFIPFKSRVKLEAIGLAMPFGESCPKTIKLFAGKKNLDFDDAETEKATKTIKIKQIPQQKEDEEKKYWAKSYPLQLTKFRNINFLTIFIKDNFGDDISELFKIELWGQDK